MVELQLNTSFKGQTVVRHVCSCCALNLLWKSLQENFQTKVRIGSRIMALFQHLGKHTAAAILQGQKSLEPPRKIIKCWWCVVQFLRDIALNALVRPEELCQDKARNLYIIYQIAYVVNIQTSLRRGMFISRKRAASFCLQFLITISSSTQKTYIMENTIDLRRQALRTLL
jgi:hypothetical protein